MLEKEHFESRWRKLSLCCESTNARSKLLPWFLIMKISKSMLVKIDIVSMMWNTSLYVTKSILTERGSECFETSFWHSKYLLNENEEQKINKNIFSFMSWNCLEMHFGKENREKKRKIAKHIWSINENKLFRWYHTLYSKISFSWENIFTSPFCGKRKMK